MGVGHITISSTDPKTVVHQMREMPIRDDVVRNARLRKDETHGPRLLSVSNQAASGEPGAR
jgi:hypothetical protein